MRSDPEKYHRRSIRLKQYDYSQAGAYFVTVCAYNHKLLFGDIVDGGMRLAEVGKMVQKVWQELPEHYFGCTTDIFTTMPNHIHGIIFLTDVETVGAGPCACPPTDTGRPQGAAPTGISLSDVLQRFKSLTTTLYRKYTTENNRMTSSNKLWQRNYYEYVIRNEDELERIRQYIQENPLKWEIDKENPSAKSPKPKEAWQV